MTACKLMFCIPRALEGFVPDNGNEQTHFFVECVDPVENRFCQLDRRNLFPRDQFHCIGQCHHSASGTVAGATLPRSTERRPIVSSRMIFRISLASGLSSLSGSDWSDIDLPQALLPQFHKERTQ